MFNGYKGRILFNCSIEIFDKMQYLTFNGVFKKKMFNVNAFEGRKDRTKQQFKLNANSNNADIIHLIQVASPRGMIVFNVCFLFLH